MIAQQVFESPRPGGLFFHRVSAGDGGVGEEFLSRREQESRIHLDGVFQHRFGIAGSGDGEFHHQLRVVVAVKDSLFQKDSGGHTFRTRTNIPRLR